VPEILVRIEMEDFEKWLAVHYEHEEDRRVHGMVDGPVYRDIGNPNAALFHIHAEDMDRAISWFRSDKFREATQRATVTGREFYIGERRHPPSG
jgi:heme-degrading monooxygenase HmoA